MNVLIVGGTGLIGRALVDELLAHHHEVVLLTRSVSRTSPHPKARLVEWNATPFGGWISKIEDVDAVINLAGEPIGDRRWTAGQKERILSSRLDSTRAVVQAIARAKNPPRLLVNASAVGYYGHVPDGDTTETSPKGIGFLADVCEVWEREATKARRSDGATRVVLLRTGIVLHPSGGAMKKMLLPFRFFAGGPIGSGRQWFPWIHLADEVSAIRFLIEHADAAGPFNLSAPNPVTMREFCGALGRAIRRPSWAPVPEFVLRAALGEMASMVLEGQRAVPERLLGLGYRFRFAELEGALKDLLRA